jgi:hypothetical protein
MKYNKPIQHGEMILKPIDKLPEGEVKIVDEFLGARSTAGHHHVLQSKSMKVVEGKDHNYIEATQEGIVTHLKDGDKHPDIKLPVGIYQINIKTEYDVFENAIRAVED